MANNELNNPFQGITLEMIVNYLVENYGWDELSKKIKINCFSNNPNLKSTLKFLRTTPWARKKVEDLYLYHKRKMVK
jgi:uncharacterized protein (DUF2132 family)